MTDHRMFCLLFLTALKLVSFALLVGTFLSLHNQINSKSKTVRCVLYLVV